MSIINRVWDAHLTGTVQWITPSLDKAGSYYPGPGVFSTQTSDFVAEGILENEQSLTVPVAPTLVVPSGSVQGLWLFGGGLTDESLNGITLTASGLTALYTPSSTPGEIGFLKTSTGFLVDNSVDVAMQITGAMTGELMFKPKDIVSTGAGGGVGYMFTISIGGAGPTTNLLWGLLVDITTNELAYYHEYANGGASFERVGSGISLTPGQWHHLAFTRDSAGTRIRVYVNGIMTAREIVANAPAGGSVARLLIGDETGGTVRIDGSWAWARITDEEFKPEDMLAIARATLPPDLRP